ncbi:MAG: MFS transporter [Methanomassiliicoccales archaeon]|nr:MFS transporter [Methanomassiliicoccales archaeon]
MVENGGKSKVGQRSAVIAGLLLLATLVGYIARANISVALPFVAEDFAWNSQQLGELGGILLGIFLIGYGFSNVLISPLVDVFGPRKSLMAAIFAWSLFTFLTGILGVFYWMFIVSRLFVGLSQGILFPSASKVTQAWFPPSARSRINSLYLLSGFLSNLMMPLLLIPLIMVTNWETMFFVVAAVGFLLLIPIWRLLRDTPEERSISRPKFGVRALMSETRRNLSEAVRIRGLWIITFSFLFTNLAWWGLSLWLPTYLIEARGFSVDQVVWGASLPYIGGIAGMLIGSWISDKSGRRIETAAVFAIVCAFFLIMLVMTTTFESVLLVLAMVFFFLGVMAPTAFTLIQGITPPRLMSSATGIVNGIANGGGVMGPLLLGMAVAMTSSYDTGLIIMAVFQVLAAMLLLSLIVTGRANRVTT